MNSEDARRLSVSWVASARLQHLFAGHKENLISICGDARHPKTTLVDTTLPLCFMCRLQLNIILKPEKYAATKGARIWHNGTR